MSKSFYFAGWLIDGSGSPARKDILIEVENGVISSLERANLVDVENRGLDIEAYPDSTILPGLVDSHVHLSMSGKIDRQLRSTQLQNSFEQNRPLISERIKKSLDFGIMALRDAGDACGHVLRYMKLYGSLNVHVKCAGHGWRASGRYGKLIGRVPENGLSLAESIKAYSNGADHIKIINSGINSLNEFGLETPPQFSCDELKAAFESARAIGCKIMVHANGRLPVQFAIEAGCDSIEHGFFMGSDNLKRMADRQIFWVPTAFTMKAFSVNNPGSPQSQVADRILDAQLEQMRMAKDLGVHVAPGTDAGGFGVRHGEALSKELKLMTTTGFSIEEAIGCATAGGAGLLGLDQELGALRRGMPANFLLVGGTPSGLPDSLEKIKRVFIRSRKII